MSRLTEIYEGWKNYFFPTPEIEALAHERIAICVECEHLNALNVCSACFCPTAGKARNPESRCSKNKWPDGWGVQPEQPVINAPELQIPVFVWDEETQAWVKPAVDNTLKVINK